MGRNTEETTGSIQSVGPIGVWVPPNLTAEMILAGAAVIRERVSELGPYSARHLASDVFAAMRAAAEESES